MLKLSTWVHSAFQWAIHRNTTCFKYYTSHKKMGNAVHITGMNKICGNKITCADAFWIQLAQGGCMCEDM
jgi:hypothetical protein